MTVNNSKNLTYSKHDVEKLEEVSTHDATSIQSHDDCVQTDHHILQKQNTQI